MNIEVLVSCMNENAIEIIKRSNLEEVRTLIVDQCNKKRDCLTEIDDKHRVIYTNTRGLSVSRNIAIDNAIGDICIISDNDEVFKKDLCSIVTKTYLMLPDADMVIFRIENINKIRGVSCRRLKKLEMLKVASWMISFKKNSVKNKVAFDPRLGAGTKNGDGEENKFMLDCYKSGLKIYYAPYEIARLTSEKESTWFHGFDEKYFYNKGMVWRYTLGFAVTAFYALYSIAKNWKSYTQNLSIYEVAFYIYKGIVENRLGRKGI